MTEAEQKFLERFTLSDKEYLIYGKEIIGDIYTPRVQIRITEKGKNYAKNN